MYHALRFTVGCVCFWTRIYHLQQYLRFLYEILIGIDRSGRVWFLLLVDSWDETDRLEVYCNLRLFLMAVFDFYSRNSQIPCQMIDNKIKTNICCESVSIALNVDIEKIQRRILFDEI